MVYFKQIDHTLSGVQRMCYQTQCLKLIKYKNPFKIIHDSVKPSILMLAFGE